MKKFSMMLLVLTLSLTLVIPSVGAETVTKENPITDKDITTLKKGQEGYEFIDEEGNTLIFETEEDYNKYQQTRNSSINNSSDIAQLAYRNRTTKKLISSSRKNMLWVGYHSGTPGWKKASSYTIQAGKSYSASGSYSYAGVSVSTSFSYSKSVSSTIPANKNKWSRLGVWGDFTFSKYKITVYDRLGQWSYTKVEKKRHNYYIKPKYK